MWTYTSIPTYVFRAWCTTKHSQNFTFHLEQIVAFLCGSPTNNNSSTHYWIAIDHGVDIMHVYTNSLLSVRETWRSCELPEW
jgi:hypothetical protein